MSRIPRRMAPPGSRPGWCERGRLGWRARCSCGIAFPASERLQITDRASDPAALLGERLAYWLGLTRLNGHPDLTLADGDVHRLHLAELDRVHVLALPVDPGNPAVTARDPDVMVVGGESDRSVADRDNSRDGDRTPTARLGDIEAGDGVTAEVRDPDVPGTHDDGARRPAGADGVGDFVRSRADARQRAVAVVCDPRRAEAECNRNRVDPVHADFGDAIAVRVDPRRQRGGARVPHRVRADGDG